LQKKLKDAILKEECGKGDVDRLRIQIYTLKWFVPSHIGKLFSLLPKGNEDVKFDLLLGKCVERRS